MSQTKPPLAFSAQIDGDEIDIFIRACAALGVPANGKTAGAIAREALLEWCAWLDARAQFPTTQEQRRYRALRLFGRVVLGLPTRKQVQSAFPLLTPRQVANIIDYLAVADDPVYARHMNTQLKAVLDIAIKAAPKGAQVISLWIDAAVAPVLQDLLDQQFQQGHLQSQVKGAPAGDRVRFAAIEMPVAKAIQAKL